MITVNQHHFLFRFLYADPTPSALQVLQRSAGAVCSAIDDVPTEANVEDGMWINADPIKGCIVVNIGESQSLIDHSWATSEHGCHN